MEHDVDESARHKQLIEQAREGHAHDLWFLALHVLRVQPSRENALQAADLISAFDVDKAPEVKLLLGQLYLLAGARDDGLDVLDELIEDEYPPAMCTVANELINGATEYTETTAESLLTKARDLGSVRARHMLAALHHIEAPWYLKVFSFIHRSFWRYRVMRYWATTKAADWQYL